MEGFKYLILTRRRRPSFHIASTQPRSCSVETIGKGKEGYDCQTFREREGHLSLSLQKHMPVGPAWWLVVSPDCWSAIIVARLSSALTNMRNTPRTPQSPSKIRATCHQDRVRETYSQWQDIQLQSMIIILRRRSTSTPIPPR